jgi:hypothetical protein
MPRRRSSLCGLRRSGLSCGDCIRIGHPNLKDLTGAELMVTKPDRRCQRAIQLA